MRTDHPDCTGVASDAIGRKAFQQPFKQDSTRDHPNGCAQPVHDRVQVHGGERATRGCHDPHGGQQLTGPVHVDTQLLQNRRAIGPDGHGAAACLHIRPLFEDGDVMPVAQQSPGNGNAAHTGADDEDPKRPGRRRVRHWHQLRGTPVAGFVLVLQLTAHFSPLRAVRKPIAQAALAASAARVQRTTRRLKSRPVSNGFISNLLLLPRRDLDEKFTGRRNCCRVGSSNADQCQAGRVAPRFLTARQDAIRSACRLATAASTAWVDARLPTVIRAAPSV